VYKFKLVLVATLFFGIGSVFAHHLDPETIKTRIQPSGSVYQEGDDVPVAKPAVVAATGPRSGKEIYNTKCVACHGTGVMGAPKFGTAADWAPRIAKGEEILFGSAIKGFNAMPPKGTCSDCSDNEIKETVKYMASNSQ